MVDTQTGMFSAPIGGDVGSLCELRLEGKRPLSPA